MIKNSEFKNKALLFSVLGVLLINLILFLVKLSVGLSANSISIYSDAINNLFDCISAVLTLCSFSVLSVGAYAEKTEQLLSFLISCFIGFSGAYFLYSSAERLATSYDISETKACRKTETACSATHSLLHCVACFTDSLVSSGYNHI
ncbi:MAG: cation transporter [Clostridia bacterium]|nr:cation transporter [Clostridia bacterium]